MSPDIVVEFSNKFNTLASELSKEDLNKFLGMASLVEVPEGRKLVKARMPVDSVYMTLSGKLEVFAENHGKAVKVNEVGPGEWVGEISVLSGDGRASASISTATDVRLLRLRHRAFEELIAGDGDLSMMILQYLVLLMSRRLLGLMELQEERLQKTPKVALLDAERIDTAERDSYWPDCRLGDVSANFKGFLRAQPGLEDFSAKDLEILQGALKLTLYPAGHNFTTQGESGDSIFLVVDGAVSQRVFDPVSKSSSWTVVNVGEWFALTSLVEEQKEFSTASAIKPVYVASLTRDDFNQLFDESGAISRFVLYMLVKELARKVQFILQSILK